MNRSRKSAGLATKLRQKAKSTGESSKASKPITSESAGREAKLDELPLELQQLLLNVFEIAFAKPNGRPLTDVIQEVKGHLYNRNFTAAFGKDEYLHAYAARWSSSRALGYLKLLDRIFSDYLDDTVFSVQERSDSEAVKVTCLGGGAGAELVALAGLIRQRTEKLTVTDISSPVIDSSEDTCQASTYRIEAAILDIADWGAVVDALHTGVTTQLPLSVYASAAAKAANKSLTAHTSLKTSFKMMDILTMSEDDVRAMSASQNLITLCFTLNELYSTSMPRTQAFLLNLTNTVDNGALLLVVDSAGSYSTVSLSGQEKRYPMHWLLDHALLKSEQVKGQKEVDAKWEKLQEKESEWFRIPEGLKYPLDLENMRYQLHLYRRL